MHQGSGLVRSRPGGLTHTQPVTRQRAEGRGRQAKHDSAAPGVHPSHLSPLRQVGLGSCAPAIGSETRMPATEPQS